MAEGVVQDFFLDVEIGLVVSLDQHYVCDAVPLDQVRAIFTLVGSCPGASVLICSYAPLTSPHRPSTRTFAEGIVRYTHESATLVPAVGKDRSPEDKATCLELLLRELDYLLDIPVSIVHFDDSWRITHASCNFCARGLSAFKGVTWDSTKY